MTTKTLSQLCALDLGKRVRGGGEDLMIQLLSTPPPRVLPGTTFSRSRRGTVSHVARAVFPSNREKGQTLIALCGITGHLPDAYRGDRSARLVREEPLCKNCRRFLL